MRNRLIKFILSFTDYDRIKKENEELKKDVYVLIGRQGKIDYFNVLLKYKMQYMIDKMVWLGNAGVECNRFKGFFNVTDTGL